MVNVTFQLLKDDKFLKKLKNRCLLILLTLKHFYLRLNDHGNLIFPNHLSL